MPMPIGNRFVKYVMGAIVDLHYMLVFHFFTSFISKFWNLDEKVVELYKQCGRFYGPLWDLRLLWSFLGKLWVPVENSKLFAIIATCTLGSLDVCFRVSLPLRLCLKSDGYLWMNEWMNININKMLRWAFHFEVDTRCSLMYLIAN